MPKMLSFDAIREKVRDAIVAVRPKRPDGYSGVWVREMFDDYAIFGDDSSGGNKSYRVAYTLGDSGDVTLSEMVEVDEVRTYEPVVNGATFSITNDLPDTDNGDVLYSGKIFEAGDFADKGINVSDDDLEKAVAAFGAPVNGDYEHVDGLLNGQLGKLVEISRKGSELFGVYSMPKWLHEKTGGKVKVSVAIDRAKKTISGIGLTLNPRIADAELIAAFSANQKQDDSETERTGKKKMNLLQKLAAFFSGLTEAERDVIATGEVDPAKFGATPSPIAEPKTVEPTVVVKFSNDAAITAAASAFADKAIADDKAVPAERESLAALYSNAAAAEFTDSVAFSESASVGILKAVIDMVAAHPKLNLQTEVLGNQSTFSANPARPDGFTPERRVELLSATELGKKALKESN
jgi:hypothetical protein